MFYPFRYLFCTAFVVEHLLGKSASALPHQACLVGVSGYVFDGSLPAFNIAIVYGDATAKAVEVDGYLRIATADDGESEGECFHHGGESGGVACAVAADDNAVGFRHLARYLVRQQSANLHHVDVVGWLATLHGFEVGVRHVRVRIDTYI